MFSEDILDFSHIKQALQAHCSSTLAKEYALHIKAMQNKDKIQEALNETVEAIQSLQSEIEQPLGGTRDIREACKKSKKDIVLSKEMFRDIFVSILAYKRVHRFFKANYIKYPLLALWIQDMPNFDRLEGKLRRTFDDKGELLDTASPKLSQVCASIKHTKERIKHELQNILQNKENQKYFQELLVTQRNNRYVVPVKSEYRHMVEGLVHDRSATGSTLYIEPMRLVELNNDLQEALLNEEQEILRIYTELSGYVKSDSHSLLDTCERIGHIEFVYGKASLAISMKATPAILSDQNEIKLLRARHPLIEPQQVVPIDIILGKTYHILLITGSNTGGKTVALKTLGLLSLMNQCGLCIPAETGSILPVFQNIYADIGDEQSIVASLSTFSAHMRHIKKILSHITCRDLVLLDEVGSGTDPEEGSSLALAIIEYLRMRNVLTMVSTHYNELKHYAYEISGVENGHVEFDERTLRPTYRLHIGVAGSSHALSIAARLGLPQEIIANAKETKNSFATSNMDAILSQLNEELRKTKEKERALKKELEETRRLRSQVEREKQSIHEKKKIILTKAQKEAESLKRSIRIESERIIKELKSQFSETDKQKRQDVITEARKSVSKVQVPLENSDDERQLLPIDQVIVGHMVYVKSLNALGTILSIQGKRATVDVNGLTATVKVMDLYAMTDEESKKLARNQNVGTIKQGRKRSNAAILRQQQAKTEINLLGCTVDEGVVKVGQFIDQALLAGIGSVRIIHGKGTGALREGIHNYLRTLPQVSHFEIAGYDEGGAGATNVVLK